MVGTRERKLPALRGRAETHALRPTSQAPERVPKTCLTEGKKEWLL